MVHPKEGDAPFFVEWKIKERWNVEVFGMRQQYSVASLLDLMVIAALLGIYGQSIAYFFADMLTVHGRRHGLIRICLLEKIGVSIPAERNRF